MSDEELLGRGLVEEVCERYRNLIYSRANSILAPGEDVEDVAGTIRAAFLARLRKYRPQPRVGFRAWARTVVDRLAIDYQRYRRRRPSTVGLPESIESHLPDSEGVFEVLARLLTDDELIAVERSARTGQPLGDDLARVVAIQLGFVRVPGGVGQLFDLVPAPAPDSINTGLSACSPRTLARLLGSPILPGQAWPKDCGQVTNPEFRGRIATRSVGPFRVTGESRAIDRLKTALDDLLAHRPALHAALGSAGMMCVRHVRGAPGVPSNHSWGTAIDFTIHGRLDPRGDRKVQQGLLELYPIMHRHGFYWGAEFRIEDGMHFELAEQTVREIYG
jgi:RNA polymerase sigma factor (sigma-70 family)